MLNFSITNGHTSHVLTIQKIRSGNFTLGPTLNQIIIGNGETDRTFTILHIDQLYNGYHHTKLGAVFINLDKLFPCAKLGNVSACKKFTQEEDGFFKGKTITEASDQGNNFNFFGNASTQDITSPALKLLFVVKLNLDLEIMT